MPASGSGGRLWLARHAITVARVRVGERISVSDGDGLLATGIVSSTEGGAVTVEIESTAWHPAPTPELWLAQALAKGDRDELAVRPNSGCRA